MSGSQSCPFSVLDLRPTASPSDVKSAYRNLGMLPRAHPPLVPTSSLASDLHVLVVAQQNGTIPMSTQEMPELRIASNA